MPRRWEINPAHRAGGYYISPPPPGLRRREAVIDNAPPHSARPHTTEEVHERVLVPDRLHEHMSILLNLEPMSAEEFPGELLTAMLYLVPKEKTETLLFWYMFTSRLPAALVASLYGLEHIPIRDFATTADRIWIAFISGPPVAGDVFAPPPPPVGGYSAQWGPPSASASSRRIIHPAPFPWEDGFED